MGTSGKGGSGCVASGTGLGWVIEAVGASLGCSVDAGAGAASPAGAASAIDVPADSDVDDGYNTKATKAANTSTPPITIHGGPPGRAVAVGGALCRILLFEPITPFYIREDKQINGSNQQCFVVIIRGLAFSLARAQTSSFLPRQFGPPPARTLSADPSGCAGDRLLPRSRRRHRDAPVGGTVPARCP